MNARSRFQPIVHGLSFAAGDAAIAERETDLGDMEATVRTLGNV